MATWYYYNANNEKIGPLKGRELKQLAQQGTITPKTKVEDSGGRTALAKNVTGLTFAETAVSQVENLGEQDFERLRKDIDQLQNQQEKKQPVPQAPPVPPPAGPNPFSAPLPGTAPAGANPFSAPIPPPIPHSNRKPLGEMMAAAMQTTMSLITSAVGMVLALMLAVVVILLIWCLLEMANIVPRVLPYHPFLPPPVTGNIVVDDDDVDNNDIADVPVEEPGNLPVMPPVVPPVAPEDREPPVVREPLPPDGEERRRREAEERRIAAERRQADMQRRIELIARAVHIDTALREAGFSGGNAMTDLANFGTATLEADLNRTYNIWNRASPYDKERTRAEFEGVRTRIGNHVRTQITPNTYFGNWSYSVSGQVVGGNESSFTLSIHVGFNALRFHSLAIEDTTLRLPQGVSATVSSFSGSQIRLHVRGNTNVIREIDENRNNYRARVCFTNLRSSGVPTSRFSTPISAEVLSIEIIPTQPPRNVP